MSTRSGPSLLAAALDGDESAWGELVDEYRTLVWAVMRGMGLYGDDAEDGFQMTFVRLLENGRSVRDHERLAGWIATTARNEARSIHRKRRRVTPVGEIFDDGGDLETEDLSSGIVMDDESIAVRRALDDISERCQELLRLLFAEPPLSYEEISELLSIPVGSIGPTRARCLNRLRSSPHLEGVR